MTEVVPYGARDKGRAVRAMFDHIAPGYDVANRMMSLGLDGGWRRAAARAAGLSAGDVALDVGTGTGDLALALAAAAPGATVVGVDYAPAMLAAAPGKARRTDLAHRTQWARADGHALPFADESFDAVASAFVLRNLSDLPAAMADMARVLKPGGRLVALEASPAASWPWSWVIDTHFRLVVPLLGATLAGDRTAYTYLGASIAAFMAAEEFQRLMGDAGLAPRPAIRLLRGAILIHRGLKPRRKGQRPDRPLTGCDAGEAVPVTPGGSSS